MMVRQETFTFQLDLCWVLMGKKYTLLSLLHDLKPFACCFKKATISNNHVVECDADLGPVYTLFLVQICVSLTVQFMSEKLIVLLYCVIQAFNPVLNPK